MTKTPQEITTDFIASFMSGEIDRARGMIADDFRFEAPLHRGKGDATAYFAGAHDKAKCFRGVRIRRQCASGNEVATLYEVSIETTAGSAVQTMSE